MELKVTTLDGEERRLGHAAGRDLRPRAARRHPAALRRLAARQAPAPARTRSRTAPRSSAPARRCTSRRAPAAPVTARPASTCSAAAAARSARSCAAMRIGLPKKVRALALKHALSAKAKDGGIIVVDKASVTDGKTKALAAQLREARPDQCADHRRRRGRCGLPPGRAQHPEHRRAAGAGHQRLRHPAARQAGADQGRGRSAGGAVQMSTADPRHYDVILSPGHHREGDARVRAQPGDVQGRAATPPSRRSRKRSRSCSTSRSRASTRSSARARSRRSGHASATQSPVKRAIVTLEEGHRIDVTTGL